MKVLHSLEDARALAGVALALGNFDGVHLGHRALFKEAAAHGRPGALTFEQAANLLLASTTASPCPSAQLWVRSRA